MDRNLTSRMCLHFYRCMIYVSEYTDSIICKELFEMSYDQSEEQDKSITLKNA